MPVRRKVAKTVKKPQDQKMRNIARMETKRALARELESKFYDSAMVATSATWGGVAQALTANPVVGTSITQGTSNVQYIGGRIQPDHLSVRLICEGNAASFNSMRIIVLQVRGNNVPQVVDVLESVGNFRTTISPYDENHKDRFRILGDKTILINNVSATTNSGKIVNFSIPRSRLRSLHFTDGSGTVEDGELMLYVYGDEAAGTPPSFLMYSRFYFKDA